jgi:hypothetical protein
MVKQTWKAHFIHIWYLGWPWSEHMHIIPISRMVDFCKRYSPFHVCLTICPFAHLVYSTSHLSFVVFYSYLVSWLAMIWACTYYTDFTDPEIGIICACWYHGQSRYQIWIKCNKRQITSCVHKMCERTYGQTNLKRAITLAKINHPWNTSLLCHFIHIWYLGWPWYQHAHIIPISWMVDFCEGYSPFHVCLTIYPFAHLVYSTSHLSFVVFYSYLVSWLDYDQSRYQIWIKCDKRQMTSCVHKMCKRTYGQTNLKRAITLAKINHPWNWYNMRMLSFVFCRILFIFGILVGHDLSMCILYRFHGWLIFARLIALFMFVWPYVRPHILCTQLVIWWPTKIPNMNKMPQKTND